MEPCQVCHLIYVCRQFMCPIYSLCVLYVSKNVGNNIKREENMKTKNVTKISPPPYYFFYRAQIYFAI